MFKAEMFIELEYTHLCYRCPFYHYMGGNVHECDIGERWEADDNMRPKSCPLQEVKVMK